MIVVNCRFLSQEVTGVQRFAEEIASQLAMMRDDLVFVAPPGRLRRNALGGRRVEQIGTRGGHAWEQWDLPRAMSRRYDGALLVSLMNTGPIAYRNQVVTHHDVTYVRHPETYSLKFRTAYRLQASILLRRARAVVTVSEFSRREIADVYGLDPARIYVVPNAASSQFSMPDGESAPGSYYLAVASQLPHKNLNFLVKAFVAFVERTGSPRTLRLVGTAPAFGEDGGPELTHPRVEWSGRVSDTELAALYRGARALIIPSLYEGFGVPPLEAQASGCPVLSSSAASLPEVLRDSALYFDPTDSEDLVRLLTTSDAFSQHERERLRSLGARNVARFDWRRSASLLSEMLDTLQAGR